MSIERLVSSRTEVSVPDEAEVWELASEEAGQAFEVLSSDTARQILSRLYDEPQTASELADDLDMSLQNVDYHLQRLQDADLIEVATTRYSSTGNEMKVYAPTTNAVLLLSKESTAQRIRSRLARLFSSLLFIAVGALAFRTLLIGTLIDVPEAEITVGPGGDSGPTEDEAATDDATSTAAGDGDAGADSADGASFQTDDSGDEVPELASEPLEYVETINPLEHLPWLLDPGVVFVVGALFAVLAILALQRTVWRRQE